MRVQIDNQLNGLIFRKPGLSQKEISHSSEIPAPTLNGYTQGTQTVPIQKAAKINSAVGDDLFGSQMGRQYFGTIQALDGKVAEILTPTELDLLQEMETDQREERRKNAKVLLVKSRLEPLTNEDREDLEKYVMEFLDEIVVELSIAFSILKILGMSTKEAFANRMPEWIKKKYMRG